MFKSISIALLTGFMCVLLLPQLMLAKNTHYMTGQTGQDGAVSRRGMSRGMMGQMMGADGQYMGKNGHGMMGMSDMSALMELKPEQRAAYLKLLTKNRKDNLDLREEMLLNRVELQEVLMAPEFDKSKAEKLAEKQAELQAERVQSQLDLAIKIREMGLSWEVIPYLGHSPMSGGGYMGMMPMWQMMRGNNQGGY